jgi:hypothetical protein
VLLYNILKLRSDRTFLESKILVITKEKITPNNAETEDDDLNYEELLSELEDDIEALELIPTIVYFSINCL